MNLSYPVGNEANTPAPLANRVAEARRNRFKRGDRADLLQGNYTRKQSLAKHRATKEAERQAEQMLEQMRRLFGEETQNARRAIVDSARRFYTIGCEQEARAAADCAIRAAAYALWIVHGGEHRANSPQIKRWVEAFQSAQLNSQVCELLEYAAKLKVRKGQRSLWRLIETASECVRLLDSKVIGKGGAPCRF